MFYCVLEADISMLNGASAAFWTRQVSYMQRGDFCHFIIPFGLLIKVHTAAVILVFWFIIPNRSAWDSCLILLVIPAL